jgi:IS5 family transposase
MALGKAVAEQRFENPVEILGERLREGSIYRFLADEGARIFPDAYFADLYSGSAKGRPTVPARVLATVMVLQAFEGLSDREAVDRLEVDLRWQAASGVHTGAEAFHQTVLVGQRNRLRASARPRRLFEDTKAAATAAGAMSARVRVLDSTPLYDAVATQDTVTQLRAVLRKLLIVLDNLGPELAARVRAALSRDDDYQSPGKPPCDWEDRSAREALVDELVKDAQAALCAIEGADLAGPAADAAELLALVAGQDIEQSPDGRFHIARKVAKDRVISTVDTEARHGHKSANRHFDGYKAHLSVDPSSELIDEVTVSPANAPDARAVEELLGGHTDDPEKPEVMGDSAYGSAGARKDLEDQGFPVTAKAPPLRNSTGGFTKDDFNIDLTNHNVTCPAGHTVPVHFGRGGEGKASFKGHCRHCPLKDRCTPSQRGRTVRLHPHEDVLQCARAEQKSPEWQARYKAQRPVVERKISHFARRAWGGRKARARGAKRITTDVVARAAALNWARLAVLGLHHAEGGWALS